MNSTLPYGKSNPQTQSGRDSDKMATCGLTPIAVPPIRSPGFAEAELVIACRKTYWQDLDPTHFLAHYIDPLYRHDYHRMYFGEVVAIEGTPAWRRPWKSITFSGSSESTSKQTGGHCVDFEKEKHGGE